ncbi:hypothetical protein [Magnetospirillum sp. 64-120]|uniref:hypothetical protein n=1 Tax=Magnetospirillum sp. 64-120 TaxID=1895778 RepID=UPI00092742C7|nr:hypothetical protein [Magnetospirillum sp. 64-120]OJX65831.1 MAG: hypothetical protein BGO92_06975 [Magnetospirillum sp. 64-120]
MPMPSKTATPPVATAGDLFIAGEKVDGRSLTARRYRDQVNDLCLQLGGTLSPSETMLVRRAATLAVLCERDECAIAAGKEVDEENYRRNAAALKAMLISLGMAKKSRDVTKADMRMFDQHAAAILDME